MSLASGTRLGPYEITSPLGSGGMGEVYRARDTRLSRDVAIKILPSAFAADPDRRLRFEREARTVASLAHPNIVSLFDTGVHDGQLFAVMELLDGETLRQRLSDGALPVRKAIDYGVQIARGLGAAHEKGLVHRDLKPENVFLLRDGQVKILDFGLARETVAGGSGETATARVTDPGTVMGTVGYMSPEQVRGHDVDARSDLFSFGTVLYEMVGGQRAFQRQTAAETMTAILKEDPPELAGSRPDLSPALDRIVRHCLEKSPSERFQSARDVAFAIEALSGSDTSRTGAQPAIPTAPLARPIVLALAAIAVVAVASAYWFYASGRNREDAQLRISRVTFTGNASLAAISPDGKYVSYIQEENGQDSLWLTQLTIANHRQLLPPGANISSLTFSPDGQFIYFVRGGETGGALFQMPFTGGEPRRIRGSVHSAISFSPDGRYFAFKRGMVTPLARRDLVIATVDSEEDKVLSTHQLPAAFDGSGPAWSPDGRIIATGFRPGPSGLSVVGVRVADGGEEPILSDGKIALLQHLAWLPDETALVATAAPTRGVAPGIWRVAARGDTVTKLTDDLSVYDRHLSVASDGTLVSVSAQRGFNIWVGEDNNARRVTSGPNREDGTNGLAWTPDGKILYRSTAGGRTGLWIMNADGSEDRKVEVPAAAAQSRDPVASPDGRYLVWAALEGDAVNLWRMNRDGSRAMALTQGTLCDDPQVSVDSRWVVCSGWNETRDAYTLWKVSIDGGDPSRLLDVNARLPAIAPDGKNVAFAYTAGNAPNRYGLVPFEGGAPKPIEGYSGPTTPIAWTPDGKSLATVRTINGVTNLWSVPLDGSPTRQLTRFTEMTIPAFAWSRDGKLAVSRGTSTRDIVLIKNLAR